MSVVDLLRKFTPNALLNWNRRRKKDAQRSRLEAEREEGKGISKEMLIADLRRLGVSKGDVVLVHSSMSKIGYLAEGPKTFVDAITELVGDGGTVLMPTSPNGEFQFDFARKSPIFDVVNTPSKMGAITEYFRKMEGVVRSLSPTEPVAAWGKDAAWFVEGHFGELTPYTSKSPFYRVSERAGKLLYIGVTLDNAGTNLHTLEDAVDFKFPVYADEIFDLEVIDAEGQKHKVKTKVHNPIYSKKRKCDQLIPHFNQAGILTKGKVGRAEALVFDAAGFFQTMVKLYEKGGVTMYTPNGSK